MNVWILFFVYIVIDELIERTGEQRRDQRKVVANIALQCKSFPYAIDISKYWATAFMMIFHTHTQPKFSLRIRLRSGLLSFCGSVKLYYIILLIIWYIYDVHWCTSESWRFIWISKDWCTHTHTFKLLY